MTSEFSQRAAIVTDKVQEISNHAERLYGMKVPPVGVRFDLQGACGGMACYQTGGVYFIRFNGGMMQDDSSWPKFLSDTVPHEMAHIVCYANPSLGKNHDKGWKRVCMQLGGSGARCHDHAYTFARGKTYKYTTSTGASVMISQIMHTKIQNGKQYKNQAYRGGGDLNAQCKYEIV